MGWCVSMPMCACGQVLLTAPVTLCSCQAAGDGVQESQCMTSVAVGEGDVAQVRSVGAGLCVDDDRVVTECRSACDGV